MAYLGTDVLAHDAGAGAEGAASQWVGHDEPQDDGEDLAAVQRIRTGPRRLREGTQEAHGQRGQQGRIVHAGDGTDAGSARAGHAGRHQAA